MERKKILFICIHNSARSQMAEAFINTYYADRFEAKSAGLEPGTLNQRVVEVMKEIDIDISGNSTNGVDEFITSGEHFDYVVTVCDAASGDHCPFFPTKMQRLHWEFKDPSSAQGSDEEKRAIARTVRDEIKAKIDAWVMAQ